MQLVPIDIFTSAYKQGKLYEYASGEKIIGHNIKGGINNNDNKNVADHARVSRYFDNRLPGQIS